MKIARNLIIRGLVNYLDRDHIKNLKNLINFNVLYLAGILSGTYPDLQPDFSVMWFYGNLIYPLKPEGT